MFEMSTAQKQAFNEATHGVGAITYCHLILFFIAGLATIWLLLVFIGTIKNPECSPYEALNTFAYAVVIYIAVGVVVHFT